jgi:hypothetical protein
LASSRDAKIIEWKFVLEVRGMVLQPFHLSLTLSSDQERAQKVISVAAWVAALSPRYGAADGSM